MAKTKNGKARSGPIAALDIGTTKISCFIAASGGGRIVGIGHQVSRGVRNGLIVDMGAAEAAIRATVEAAEQMAGETIREVVVNVSGASLTSRLIACEIAVAGHQIGDADLRRVLDPTGLCVDKPADHDLLHAIPIGYSIDGNKGVHDPRGMYGERLGVNVHLLTAAGGALRNLAATVERCHLDIDSFVVAPYASALSSLIDDETQLGVTLIDMGGGTTSVSVFFDGEMVHAGCIPIGGGHVTSDIARGLSTPLAQAERLKTLYGSALSSPSDDRELLAVPVIGDEAGGAQNRIPRSMLIGIVRPRLEETFELVRAHLEATGFDKVSGRRVVLVGGASQLQGAAEMAGQILDKQVRLGRPRRVEGLAEAVSGPAFATCAGLLAFALKKPVEAPSRAYRPSEEPSGRFGRIGQWIRENF